MTASARRAIVSIVMVVTLAGTFLITLPIAQRYSAAKVQEIGATHRPGKPGHVSELIRTAVMPSLFALIGSTVVAMLVGAIVAKKLPRIETKQRRLPAVR